MTRIAPPEAERALIQRATHDPEAFGQLFEQNFDAVFGYVFRRIGDWDAARDLTSEVFLKALKALWRYRWSGKPFAAWLFAIANNEMRMYYRRGGRAPQSLDTLRREAGIDPVDPTSLAAERQRAEEEEERSTEFVRVRVALTQLPLKYQEVLALRYFEGKSVADVALFLGKRQGTVKSLLSRGVARLRELLSSAQPISSHGIEQVARTNEQFPARSPGSSKDILG